MYTYRFYRFAGPAAFLAAWVEAGLPIAEDGGPSLPGGAVDQVGKVALSDLEDDGAPPVVQPGWYVNVAWPGDEPPALASHAIEHFEGLRAFAGWNTPVPLPPVPAAISAAIGRIVLREAGKLDDLLAIVATLPVTSDTRILFDHAATWERRSPATATIGVALGLDDAAMDDLFRQAAALGG